MLVVRGMQNDSGQNVVDFCGWLLFVKFRVAGFGFRRRRQQQDGDLLAWAAGWMTIVCDNAGKVECER